MVCKNNLTGNSLLLLSFIFLLSCSTNSTDNINLQLEGSFEKDGLENQIIYQLKEVENQLFSGTNSNLYQQEVGTTQWNKLISDDVTIWTFEILSTSEIIASFDFNKFDSLTIAYTENAGETWQEYQNGFGGETKMIPLLLVHSPQNKDLIFARGLVNVAKSEDRGKTWTSIFLDWDYIGRSTFITVDSQNTDIIWAGGANAIFQPMLIRSEDGGDSWERLTVLENTEAVCYDLLIHPSDTNILLAALGGTITLSRIIRKSTDGGQTWGTVFEGINTFTLAQSPKDDRVVYASGQNAQGTLFFAASGDFGDTWQTVEFESGPTQIQVNDMISVLQNGKEVLYFGTNKGVYSFTFEN